MRFLPMLIAVLALASFGAAGAAAAPLASSRYAVVTGEPGEARLAHYLTGLVDRAAPRAARITGLETVSPVRIVIEHTGRRPPSDIVTPVGLASYPDETIHLDASLLDVTDLSAIISHEVTHVMEMRAAKPEYQALPRWFAEGVAGYVEGRSRQQADAAAQRAEEGGLEAPLTDLDDQFMRSYSVDPGQRHTVYAYAKSASVVYFLVDRDGRGVIAKLLAATRRQGGFAAALEEVTGLTEDGLDTQWRKSLRAGTWAWIALLDPNLLMWAVMALLLVVAVVRYWVVRRRREAESEEEAAEPRERKPLGW